MTNDDIASLIGRVSLRDRSAFSALYTNTSAKLYGICVRILKDRGEAEEALQEVYIKVWRRAERYVEGQTSAMAWLAAIARNHAIDVIRARKPASSDIDAAFDIADPAPGPERSALMQGEGRRIDACMEQLEAERASAVRKAYVDGESYQDLAELYGVPLNTMRTWLRRSLLKLRECMDNDDSE
ncbi:sigma-70 family RNA polymerase sigma factor [Rhizobium sp. CFBP 8762]|uniref:sigma-70 family RNA polymerase sigma factor n=1 Tax=Rhizobium sp. CFBP 8762 TaxID=2775279 RepID=UPI001780CEC2|nr:sigma-70 family RNA polymerase sigma factor [Rhizobium sp. CFBP 8762]MBD8553651.1 sigma-70 family RNA polymerase sigma factor [Rhizobium sp. CFBP 8762]